MKLFGWEISKAARAPLRPAQGHGRGRPGWYHWALPTSLWGPTIPQEKQAQIYEEMRLLFPVLDVAIRATVRLLGNVRIDAAAKTKADIELWMDTVHVNQAERSLQTWLEAHLDMLLVFGRAVGEVIPASGHRDLYALTNLDPLTVLLAQDTDPLKIRVLQRQAVPPWRVELDPAYTLLTVHQTRGRDPHGSSLFRSLPFIGTCLSTILNATNQAWEREGAPSHHVNWEPDPAFVDPDGTLSQQIVDGIATEFQATMEARRTGEVRDFFSSGKVLITDIGSPANLNALSEPFRAFMEQMVSATHLPPWMLGFHWATTERLAREQVELLVAYLDGLRRVVAPTLEGLIDLRQRFVGRSGRFKLEWDAVELYDLTQLAQGRSAAAISTGNEIENAARMWELGWLSQLEAAQRVDPDLGAVATAYSTPPGQPRHAVAPAAPPTGGKEKVERLQALLAHRQGNGGPRL